MVYRQAVWMVKIAYGCSYDMYSMSVWSYTIGYGNTVLPKWMCVW